MNRRSFLGLLGGTAAALTLDPDRLLWVPGAKTIFVPDRTVVEAANMAEALSAGLAAEWPGGQRFDLRLGGGGDWIPAQLLATIAAEIKAIEASGGRVIHNRQYRKVEL